MGFIPTETGAPGRIRTSDHQVRSLVLYPTELRAHVVCAFLADVSYLYNWRRERDSNPRWSIKPHTPLAGERLQPLGHLSRNAKPASIALVMGLKQLFSYAYASNAVQAVG